MTGLRDSNYTGRMVLNPRQKRARASSRQLQRLREIEHLTTSCTEVSNKELQSVGKRSPYHEAATTTESETTTQDCGSTDVVKGGAPTEEGTPDIGLPLTPVIRRPPPPPGSEHPRYLLCLRRRTQAHINFKGSPSGQFDFLGR